MTQEIIKTNSAESVEIQQVDEVKAPVKPVKLTEYDKLEQKLTNYDKEFVRDFIRNIKSISPLVPVGKNEPKRTILTNEEIANLLEYANFGIDISPKAGMLYYFSRGGQFGFLTPRAIIEMLAKVGLTATVEVVCSNDQFKVDPANLKINHVLGLPRGATVGVYAILRQGGKIISIEVMDMVELLKIKSIADKQLVKIKSIADKHRESATVKTKAIADKPRESATWRDHFEEMAKKTILKRIAKRTPLLDHNLKQAIDIDNKEYAPPQESEKINNVAVTTQPERV